MNPAKFSRHMWHYFIEWFIVVLLNFSHTSMYCAK